MNSARAGKQTKSYWKASSRWEERIKNEPHEAHRKDSQYQIAMDNGRGFAAGWIAGVAWVKRNAKKP